MVGIVPPFGDYVIRAEEITPFGMNETSKLMIKPPAKVQLSDLKAGTEYRVCVYNQYDQLAGGIVPDQYCTSFKLRLINATHFFPTQECLSNHSDYSDGSIRHTFNHLT